MTSSTDQFSASITPFEVPDQMRAFSEKGVSQARDYYAKFKDAAETHSGTMEAVFTTASQGASEYTAKLMEFLKANTTSTLDFAQELFGVKTPPRRRSCGPRIAARASRRSAPRPRSSPSSARRSRPRRSSRSSPARRNTTSPPPDRPAAPLLRGPGRSPGPFV